MISFEGEKKMRVLAKEWAPCDDLRVETVPFTVVKEKKTSFVNKPLAYVVNLPERVIWHLNKLKRYLLLLTSPLSYYKVKIFENS